jgi:hypothetical protein
MKNISSIRVIAFKNNSNTIQIISSLSIKRLVFILLFSFSFIHVSAQSGNTSTPSIMEVNAYISSLKAAEQNSTSSFSNAQNVESLVTDLQSSIYFNSGMVKTYGEKPKNLYTDIASLNSLSAASLKKNNIEIIIITINSTNDLNSKIDLSLFADFYKLKYIYIKSTVITTEQNITKMFLNYDEQYSIFYKIEKGE